MSGGTSALNLQDDDVTKFLASSTHTGSTNLDFQMQQYVFKRRPDVRIFVMNNSAAENALSASDDVVGIVFKASLSFITFDDRFSG
ncbi:hypothetical protein AVEN_189657-1 [Araneus ventricosus]|uniref:Uncharacterized protein n=1 Tax=Araneus ventricosus TaxID=182803 RepID=A0A4Y2PFS1_ARAVE|nr:hypothetical protein AVEN_189657-1 [Araneus ventricosus]